jgi:hypothetical protein
VVGSELGWEARMVILGVILFALLLVWLRRHGRKVKRKSTADTLGDVLGMVPVYRGPRWKESDRPNL